MDGVSRGFPPGDLRVSDADRDRALSELSEAFQVGRITADEFEQRSGQALRARTGKELTDLPIDGSPATRTTVPAPANHAFAVRAVMGASALAAILLFAKAVADALSPSVSGNVICRSRFRILALSCHAWSILVRWCPSASAAIVSWLLASRLVARLTPVVVSP